MKLKSNIFYGYAALLVAYVLLTFIPAPDKVTLTRFHLHPLALRLLDVTLIVPILIIWFAIFYGYSRLHIYAQAIKGNKDGKPVNYISRGLLVLAIGWPITSIVTTILSLIARRVPSFSAPETIISNYLSIVYFLIAFIFIGIGARGLSAISRARPPFWSVNVVVLATIILGVGFCVLIEQAHQAVRTTFHMPASVAMLTLAIPYMYIWFLGLYSVLEIIVYGQRVAGILYRQNWNRLALGLGGVLLIDIALQYLSTFTTWLNGLTLRGILLLLYVLLFIYAAAFIVVALGAQKLMRIEEA